MACEWPFEGSFGQPTTYREPYDEDLEDHHLIDDLASRQVPQREYRADQEMGYIAGEGQQAMDIARTADQLLEAFDNMPQPAASEPPTIDPALLQLDNMLLAFHSDTTESAPQSQPFHPTFEDDAHPFEQPVTTIKAPHQDQYHTKVKFTPFDPFSTGFDLFDLPQQHTTSRKEGTHRFNNIEPRPGNAGEIPQEMEVLTISRAVIGDAAAHYELQKLLDNGLLLGGTADGFSEAMKRAIASLQRSSDFPDETWSDRMIGRIESDDEGALKNFLKAAGEQYNHDNTGRKLPVSYGLLKYHHGLHGQEDRVELYALDEVTHCSCIELWSRDEAQSDEDVQGDQEEDDTARNTPSVSTNTNSTTTSASRLTRRGSRRQGVTRPSVQASHRRLQHIGMPIQYWLNKQPSEVRGLILAGGITPDEVTGEVAFTLAKGYSNSECAELIGIARDTFYNGRVLKYMQARSSQPRAPTLSELMDHLDQARRTNKIRVGRR